MNEFNRILSDLPHFVIDEIFQLAFCEIDFYEIINWIEETDFNDIITSEHSIKCVIRFIRTIHILYESKGQITFWKNDLFLRVSKTGVSKTYTLFDHVFRNYHTSKTIMSMVNDREETSVSEIVTWQVNLNEQIDSFAECFHLQSLGNTALVAKITECTLIILIPESFDPQYSQNIFPNLKHVRIFDRSNIPVFEHHLEELFEDKSIKVSFDTIIKTNSRDNIDQLKSLRIRYPRVQISYEIIFQNNHYENSLALSELRQLSSSQGYTITHANINETELSTAGYENAKALNVILFPLPVIFKDKPLWNLRVLDFYNDELKTADMNLIPASVVKLSIKSYNIINNGTWVMQSNLAHLKLSGLAWYRSTSLLQYLLPSWLGAKLFDRNNLCETPIISACSFDKANLKSLHIDYESESIQNCDSPVLLLGEIPTSLKVLTITGSSPSELNFRLGVEYMYPEYNRILFSLDTQKYPKRPQLVDNLFAVRGLDF